MRFDDIRFEWEPTEDGTGVRFVAYLPVGVIPTDEERASLREYMDACTEVARERLARAAAGLEAGR